jgi:thioredoxin-dependent peroxiredoxin
MTIDQLGQVSITCPTKSEHWHGLVAELTEKERRAMRTFVGFPMTGAVVLAPTASCHGTDESKEKTMEERTDLVTLKGGPVTLLGPEVKAGQPAPNVELTANDLSTVQLSSSKGKVCIVIAVPSLDTPVCDTETRRFNEEAANLGDDVVVLAVSMDLPFAQARWCGAAGIKNVQTLSDHRDAAFGASYGVLIKGLRLLARAVFVVDKQGVVRYTELVKEVTNEPDYDAALAAVKEAM